MAEINSAEIGFEKEIWKAADKMRGNIDASEYKSVVLGLIFLKYISDKFEAKYDELVAEGIGMEEDKDEYLAENIFYVPTEARWAAIAERAHTPEIGTAIDDAMRAIERENKRLKDILPKNNADTFFNDCHPTLKADFVMANPPFNLSDWGADKLSDDVRWKYGTPPNGNANFAWIQHIIHHLAPSGRAGIVLANGSLSSQSGGEGEIRKQIVEADLVDCIVAMPSQLFYTTQIPVSVWFLNKDKKQKGKTLFIDARNMGTMITRKLRQLTGEDIHTIAKTVETFEAGTLTEEKDFCAVVPTAEIAKQDFILTPGRYVGIAEQEADAEPFEEKMARLTGELSGLFEQSHTLFDHAVYLKIGEILSLFNNVRQEYYQLGLNGLKFNDQITQEKKLRIEQTLVLYANDVEKMNSELNQILPGFSDCLKDWQKSVIAFNDYVDNSGIKDDFDKYIMIHNLDK